MTKGPIRRQLVGQRTLEGGGFPVRRPFPVPGCDQVDPFLLLDEMGPKHWRPGEAIGAPEHPHRGFETITYLLSGSMVHEDSTGTCAHLAPGGVQWMTAGSGVIHSELPSPDFHESGGLLHGFQLWVNLPKSKKMLPARYQGMTSEEIPTLEGPGYTLRVIGGEILGLRSPVRTEIPITYAHLSLGSMGRLKLPLPADQPTHLYPFQGQVTIEGHMVEEGTFVSLEALQAAEITAGSDGLECLILAAKPLHEPMVRYGPFVMNSRHELIAAIEDYQAGRLTDVHPP
ncbi:MAG TPA: pirin family protein [Myxococcales bacterium]|nr:pirin family protein [Myxococcales bacterium]